MKKIILATCIITSSLCLMASNNDDFEIISKEEFEQEELTAYKEIKSIYDDLIKKINDYYGHKLEYLNTRIKAFEQQLSDPSLTRNVQLTVKNSIATYKSLKNRLTHNVTAQLDEAAAWFKTTIEKIKILAKEDAIEKNKTAPKEDSAEKTGSWFSWASWFTKKPEPHHQEQEKVNLLVQEASAAVAAVPQEGSETKPQEEKKGWLSWW